MAEGDDNRSSNGDVEEVEWEEEVDESEEEIEESDDDYDGNEEDSDEVTEDGGDEEDYSDEDNRDYGWGHQVSPRRQIIPLGTGKGVFNLFDLPFEITESILNEAVKLQEVAATLMNTSRHLNTNIPTLKGFQSLPGPRQRYELMVAALKRKGDAEEIAVVMEEMNWYFKCTSYPSDRLVAYDEFSDEDEDEWYEDDYDCWGDGRRQYHRGPRTHVDSDHGKSLAKSKWVKKHIESTHYVLVQELPAADGRPPKSLWDPLNDLLKSIWAKLIKPIIRQIKSAAETSSDVDTGNHREESLKLIMNLLDSREGKSSNMGALTRKLMSKNEMYALISRRSLE
ncbi:hypothetical protein SeMB42_g00345 [Synchytrium endobioticum]|uniref:Uncharacterized protein n=1 Tax=Synchytrium endobioticum TaxID=286115 RepID=A0A507DRB3_9FUNG|nr:hypothetical protein SeLEV6574_g00916 [Synchytrium endobioticum]TPX54274.1 hypothetical protein SeMB42_g00345 [Synchytrium endobioticum]